MKRFLFLFSTTLLLTVSGLRAEDLAIIVHKNGPDSVTSAELTKMLRAEKSKDSVGNKIALTMREPGSAERNTVLAVVYQMSESEYTKFFLQATFTGAVAAAPKQFPSAAAMRQFVAGTPGAIGYVRAADVDSSVKVLKVDGKLPGEAGYPVPVK